MYIMGCQLFIQSINIAHDYEDEGYEGESAKKVNLSQHDIFPRFQFRVVSP